jgi:hypothetical protein
MAGEGTAETVAAYWSLLLLHVHRVHWPQLFLGLADWERFWAAPRGTSRALKVTKAPGMAAKRRVLESFMAIGFEVVFNTWPKVRLTPCGVQ